MDISSSGKGLYEGIGCAPFMQSIHLDSSLQISQSFRHWFGCGDASIRFVVFESRRLRFLRIFVGSGFTLWLLSHLKAPFIAHIVLGNCKWGRFSSGNCSTERMTGLFIQFFFWGFQRLLRAAVIWFVVYKSRILTGSRIHHEDYLNQRSFGVHGWFD